MNAKRGQIDPEALGLWECCEGVWYTAAGRCGVCGRTGPKYVRTCGEDLPAGVPEPEPEPAPRPALDFGDETSGIVPRDDAKFIIVLSRGYTGIPLDGDNLVASFKALRDAIAEHLLRTASDAERSGLQWEYRQFRGKGTKAAIWRRKETEVKK